MNLISRGLLLAGLPFLSSYFTFTDSLNRTWFWPFLCLFSIGSIYDHRNRHGDYGGIQRTRLHRIAAQFGERTANLVLVILLFVSLAAGFVSAFLINLIPSWVIITISALLVLFVLPSLFKFRRDTTNVAVPGLILKALERAFALGLTLQLVIPWLVDFF